jgi:hypothetical protein
MFETNVSRINQSIKITIPKHVYLSEKQIDGINSIWLYSFSDIHEKLLAERAIPVESIEDAIEEFRKFLTIALIYPDKPIAMTSKIVDEVWHTFILFTRDYMTFTQNVFGSFLHHNPQTSSKRLDRSSATNFLDAYNEIFGELSTIWVNKSHDCDVSDTEISGICQGGGCDNDPIACSPMADSGETTDTEQS